VVIKKITNKNKMTYKLKNKKLYTKKNVLNRKRTLQNSKRTLKNNSNTNQQLNTINIETEILINNLKNGSAKYPQLSLFEKPVNIKKRMSALSGYKYKLIHKPYKFKSNIKLPAEFFKYRNIKTNKIQPTVILFGHENYLKYDLISDYFQEEARMKCRRYNSSTSPMDYWLNTNNTRKIIEHTIKKYGKVSDFTLRETLFELTNACSSFRPTVLVSLVKLLGKGKRILDISAGWGDRLIGAIAVKADYYFAVDPNPEVHKGYDAIRHFFGVSDKKFVIKRSGFEKVNIELPPKQAGKEVKFDLIMTSPPYFDLEIYTDAQGQSVLGRGKKAWLEDFMFPSLKKAWDVLEVDGILALNINNKREKNVAGYIEEIISYMNNMPDTDFRGCIAYGDYRRGTTQLRNPQPVWIWRKLPDIKTQQAKFRELLKTYYNPKLQIIPETIPNPNKKSDKQQITINVIRDDLLEAGAKQRAMIPYFQENPAREFVYMSPFTGSAQVTLSYSALYTGKRTTVFLDKRKPRHPLTRKAVSYGLTNLIEIQNGGFKKMEPMVDEYVRWKQLEKGKDYVYKFSLGFANNRWINILAKQLKAALPTTLLHNPPSRIWVPTGSTALINALYRVFPAKEYPNLQFLVVQIGKTVWDDQVDLTRTKIYRTTEFFYDVAKRQPPFPSSRAYDAKAWAFVLDHGEDGDYLMNVIADPIDAI
jgi:16S rRNA G966 N2-methylase RsmD